MGLGNLSKVTYLVSNWELSHKDVLSSIGESTYMPDNSGKFKTKVIC